MRKLDPLLDELELAIEQNIIEYKDAGGSPEGAIGFFANYLEYMIRAQPKRIREAAKIAIHKRICKMD